MKKIVVNFDFPPAGDKDRINHLYLGGKDLHDLPLDTEIDLLCDLLESYKSNTRKMIAGRLDADRNIEFAKFLEQKQLQFHLFKGDIVELSLGKKLSRAISQDYSQPWIFFEPPDADLTRILLNEFWSCYGGFWVFFLTNNDFERGYWQKKKETMNYDIWSLVRSSALQFDAALLIGDDFAIEMFSQKLGPEELLNVVFKVASTYRLGVNTG